QPSSGLSPPPQRRVLVTATQCRVAQHTGASAMNRNRNPVPTTFESLEDRRLCSATLVGSTVRVGGTDAAETVTVSEFVSNSELSLGVRFLRVKETINRP